jgi:pimeloyl-ACP methyl ester carboxylesterase
MNDVRSSTVEIAVGPCRVLEKGSGERVGYLAGLGGVPTWLPFLDELAETRRVVVPSLPGFPGAPKGFHSLDDHLDWLTATLDLLEAAGLDGADLIASSVAGMLAADVAVFSPAMVRRLVLISPWGLYDPAVPGADVFATTPEEQPALVAAHPERLAEVMAAPEGSDALEWRIDEYRASEAAARISWPMGDRGLIKRMHRISHSTLLVWGEQDRILPPAYADRWAEGISGPTEIVMVADAGHHCVIDQPVVAAKHVRSYLES